MVTLQQFLFIVILIEEWLAISRYNTYTKHNISDSYHWYLTHTTEGKQQYSINILAQAATPLKCINGTAQSDNSRHMVVRQQFIGLINENKRIQRNENNPSFFLYFSTKRSTHPHTLKWLLRASYWNIAWSHKSNVSIFIKWYPIRPALEQIKSKCDIHLEAIAQAGQSFQFGPYKNLRFILEA